jgi:hypothetical protein
VALFHWELVKIRESHANELITILVDDSRAMGCCEQSFFGTSDLSPVSFFMITMNQTVGRLIELRFLSPVSLAETQEMAVKLRQMLDRPSKSFIFCCDARSVTVFPPDVAELLTNAMKMDNPRIVGNGLIFGTSSLFGMQIERLFREAKNPARRAFQDMNPLKAWFSTILTPAEQERMLAFLNENEKTARAKVVQYK